MGFSTHLGPWLLGTVKDTTATTAGNVRNTGTSIVSQTKKVNFAGTTTGGVTTNIAVLPAGAQIINIFVDTLVAFTGSTAANMTLGVSGTVAAYWTTTDITTAGRAAATNSVLSAWAGATSAAAPDGIGIGPLDVLVNAYLTPTVATATAGTVQFTVVYAVRNTDGTSAPAAA
jgi:hypothetical protein